MRRPKLADHEGFIEQILEDDGRAPGKQRYTAQRIFERLRDERGFDGGYSTVRDYVRSRRQVHKEVFVPPAHPPGARPGRLRRGDRGAWRRRTEGPVLRYGSPLRALLVRATMATPQSDAVFVKAYHAETAEAFCDGHVEAFAFFGGVPLSILCENTRLAVSQILGSEPSRRHAFGTAGEHAQAQPPLRGPAMPLRLRRSLWAAGEGRR